MLDNSKKLSNIQYLIPTTYHPTPNTNININRTPINNPARTREVRVVDETGKQLGIMPLEEALRLAEEKGLDLIQVTEKVEPPVCKIGDYGKYLYQQQKKERKTKIHSGELKEIRVGFKISPHDLEIKAGLAKKFLTKGDKVKITLVLRGREKALQGFAREKIKILIEKLNSLIPIKIEKDLKKEPRGLTMIISKK